MRLTGWLSSLRPVPRPPVRRKSWRRSQRQRVARHQYADAIKQRTALGELFQLQGLLTGTYVAGGSEPVTVNFRPSGGGLASMSPVEDLPDNMGDERNSKGVDLGRGLSAGVHRQPNLSRAGRTQVPRGAKLTAFKETDSNDCIRRMK